MISSKEIADLEKKYSKFIFKKRIKLLLYIFLIVLVVFLVAFYFFYTNTTKTQKEIANVDKIQTTDALISDTDTNKTLKKNIVKSENISKIYDNNITKSTKTDIKPQKPTIQKPTIQKPTIQKPTEINNKKQKERSDTPFCFKLIPTEKKSSNHTFLKRLVFKFSLNQKDRVATTEVKAKIAKKRNKNDTITLSNSPRPKIDIEMRDIDSIQYLKDKFKKTNDIIFALMLCENYYSQKDYKNSLKWSIIANDIDSDSERSWIWFAKSKYRLNQKDDAIKALKSFLKRDDSAYIKSLLRQIVNGEMND